MAKYLVNGVFSFALLESTATVMAAHMPDVVLESGGVSSSYFRWASLPASAMLCCQIVHIVREHMLHKGVRGRVTWAESYAELG